MAWCCVVHGDTQRGAVRRVDRRLPRSHRPLPPARCRLTGQDPRVHLRSSPRFFLSCGLPGWFRTYGYRRPPTRGSSTGSPSVVGTEPRGRTTELLAATVTMLPPTLASLPNELLASRVAVCFRSRLGAASAAGPPRGSRGSQAPTISESSPRRSSQRASAFESGRARKHAKVGAVRVRPKLGTRTPPLREARASRSGASTFLPGKSTPRKRRNDGSCVR
jgi:hypothetical protein